MMKRHGLIAGGLVVAAVIVGAISPILDGGMSCLAISLIFGAVGVIVLVASRR